MKKLLQFTLFSVLLLLANIANSQSAGFNTTFAILSTNGGANAFYDLQAATVNTDFQGANLGSFNASNTLVIKGAEHNVFKCGGCDLTSTRLYYRTYLTGSTPGAFSNLNIGFFAGGGNGCGGQDQQWKNDALTTDVLSGLSAGNYTFELYSDASITCSGGTAFASNGGANYKATFSYCGPTSGTLPVGNYAIPGCFPTVLAAVNYINTNGVSGTGTVQFDVAAGYSETAPVGGFNITATGTATTAISFKKSGAGANPTFTANTALVAGALTDGIFKIIGGDFITIDGFTLLESANVTTAAATNNMTEYGIALLNASATDGPKNITIKNCTIDLNRIYTNTFGVYSNATHTATTIGTSLATAIGGEHNNLTITGNTITDVNQGIVVVGSTTETSQNNGIVIGGGVGLGNTITNYGTAAAASSFLNVSGTMNGVLVRNSKNYNISYNTISSSSAVTVSTVRGVFISAFSVAPTGTLVNTISNNIISVRSSNTTGAIFGVLVEGTTSNVASTLNINANDFNTFGHAVASSGAITFISNVTQAVLNNSISNNTFTNMSVNTTGSITFITNGFSLPVAGTKNINNNSIVTAFAKTGAGGTINLHVDNAGSVAGSTVNNNNNNFSNITLTGATAISGWVNTDGGSPLKSVNGNTFNNWTTGGAVTALSVNFFATNSTVNNNTITNITSTAGGIVGLLIGGSSTTGASVVISNNAINTLSGAGTINGLTCSNASTAGVALNDNNLHTFTNSGTFVTLNGINITGGIPNVFRNKVYNLSASASSTAVNGINVTSATLATIYNNVIGDLKAPTANLGTAITGINIPGGTTVNVYHNSVVLNAVSSGALFGTSAISASSTTALTLRNNIFINNSTPVGATGFAAAYRRSNLLTVANYPTASDNNIFYAGTPSANNVIFYDGTTVRSTLADYKTFAATRDIASQTENVAFISTTGSNADFLRIALGTTSFAESGGALVSSPLINTDYWGVTRPFVAPVNGGTAVDIGASEFDGIPNLVSCIAPADQATAFVAGAVTSNTAAATFTAAASAPSGYLVITSQGAFVGSPVNGTVYTPGAALGNGAVIQSNATTSINAVGLPSNTTGTITIYSYNSGACAGGPKYNLVTPLTGTNTTCAGTPTLPVSNAVTASGFTANWTQTGGTAFPITYTIDVTTDAAFTLPVAGSPFTSSTTSLVVSGLNAQTAYFWRVRGNNTVCDSAFLNSSATTECNAITAYPSVEPFTTYLPSVCWKEGDLGDLVAGPSLISASASSWDVDGFLNVGTTGAAKINLFDAPDSDWLITPYYTIPATGYRVKYNVGATQFGAINGALTTPWEADDFVELLVSTSTTNWTVLKTYNASNVPSNLGQVDTADLTPYNGQTVRFAFRGVEGATNGAADIDFFVDNFTVEIEPIAITVSPSVAVCNGDSTTLTVSSANTNYAYTWSPASGLNTTAGASVIATPTATTTYTVTAVDGGMLNTGTVTVTVNAAPTAITITPATASVCENDITALNVSGVNTLTSITSGLGALTSASGSTTATLGPNPLQSYYGGSKQQMLYTASELSALGFTAGTIINSIAFDMATVEARTLQNYEVFMQNSALTSFSSTSFVTSGLSKVKNAVSVTPVVGLNTIALDTPFTWNGTSSLLVQVNFSNNDGGGTGTSTSKNDTTEFASTLFYRVDSTSAAAVASATTASFAAYSSRSKVVFGLLAPTVSWSPVTDLYTDAAATVPYTGATATTVYHKGLANFYTATAALGLCTKMATSTISVNAPVLPTFFNPSPICVGGVVALPIISTNGITGTWSPAPNNTVTTIYNFTPDAGQCATNGAFITQTVNQNASSTFASIAPVCIGDAITLPATSLEGNAGTWSPAINNTETTTYTFTPNAGICALSNTLTVNVGTSTTWTGVWTNGAPTSTSSAIISAPYTEAADINACTLTINTSANVTILSGFNVFLNGALTVDAGSTFTLENNANLIQSSNVANSGDIIVKRATPSIMRQDYVLWSSPVANQNLLAFSPSTLVNRFNVYNPTTNLYDSVVPSTTSFATGTGYLIRIKNNHPTTPTSWTGTFTGVPNNGPVSVTVANNTYNAIGNPYPSAINANAFIAANGLTEALYFWRKTNSLAPTTSYATYTTAGGVANSGSDPLGLVPNGKIQVGQGFLVKSTSTSLNFTNAMRTSDAGPFLRINDDRSRVWLNMTSPEGLFTQTMVAYMPNATSGIDAAIDGRLLSEENGSTLSSLINNEEFAIQGRALPFETTDVVPMAFKSALSGSYTIAINNVDGLFDTTGQIVYLQDNLTNTVHNLTAAPYTFATEAGAFNARFQIVYQPTGTLATITPTLSENNVIVYKQDDSVIINTGKITMASVKIFDIRGRLLIEKSNINASNIKLNTGTTNQVLIVKITSNTNDVVTKKVIN